MWLSRVSVQRPVFMTMVVTVLMVLGLIGLSRIPIDLFPDVSLPVVTVVVPYPGASPAQVEEDVILPIEDAISGLRGLEDIYSTARESVAVVAVVFDMDVSVQDASNDLRDRVMGLRATFPEGVDAPILRRVDPSATPVMTWAVASELGAMATRQLTERLIKPHLERLEGVGAVNVIGGQEREIRVELDLPRLAELRIPLQQVVQLLGYDTADIPAGSLDSGRFRFGVKSTARVSSLDALGSIVVRGYPEPVYLRDVARLVDGVAKQISLARVDGRRAVTLEVVKQSGANTVAVCERVTGLMEQLDLPAGITAQPVIDTSEMARDMLHEMQRALVVGAAMAILVVYLFMTDWRSTLISALALPTSIVTTFFFMWLLGFSLNMLTLVAMALAIGVLIDDAVVVREVIYRHLEAGEDPVEASLNGTAEVALAVLATTLSILAVFVPVGFMGGLVGQFFSEFGLTIAIAVSVSLFIAFTLDPMLSSRISKVVSPGHRGPLPRHLNAAMAALDRFYLSMLSWALDHGKTVVGVALLMFAVAMGLVAVTGSEFIPAYDRSQFMVDIDLPSSSSLSYAEQVTRSVENVMEEVVEVQHIYSVVGLDGASDRVQMRVGTLKKNERKRTIYEIQDDVRQRLSRIAGVTVAVRDPPMLEGAEMGSDIDIEIRGHSLASLRAVADRVRTGLAEISGAVNIRTTYHSGRPEMRLQVDREQAARAGLSVGQAGMALRMAVTGSVIGKFQHDEGTSDIRVLARKEDLNPATLLSSILLLSPVPRPDDPMGLGTPIALQDIARVEYETAPSTIERHDRQRFLRVSCGLAGRPLSDVVADVKDMLPGIGAPQDVDLEILGMADTAEEALGNLLFALALSIVFVYAVLASQFESFIHPFTIMLSLPLAVVGAFITVFLAGWAIGIMTMLAIILLMGLVTKNAILLVDRANQLRARGRSPREAMLEAGHLRLRPILMTSLAMIFGMLPPAVSQGSGSEINSRMALPIIGGLLASTLLTLVVVPVVYQWVEGLRGRLSGKAVRSAGKAEGPARLGAGGGET